MNTLVVGAGITGCTLAFLMKERGHNVFIKEKQSHIGGLCYTKNSPINLLFEPNGAHVFHTKWNHVKKFIKKFSKFNSYIHNKGIIINGTLRHYPLSIQTIKEMPEGAKILKELAARPEKLDYSNLENYLISKFGPTLYKLYVYNYTKKMWGIEPLRLASQWIENRIELREINSELFLNEWQGLPINGYTQMMEKMITGIPIEFNSDKFHDSDYDSILFSGRLDELFEFKYGILPYRSLGFDYKEDEPWENENYGTINIPQDPKYIRKANFKILYQQDTASSWVQYQEPISFDDNNLPMYPINIKENKIISSKYIEDACKFNNLIPVGRLGLYKYLNMDTAISLSMDMVPLIEDWKNLSPNKRLFKINGFLEKY